MSGFASQFFSRFGSVVLHQLGVSFKNNHFNTAPLLRPDVYVGLTDAEGSRDLPSLISQTNARITANGRQAIIESDLIPHSEEYQ